MPGTTTGTDAGTPPVQSSAATRMGSRGNNLDDVRRNNLSAVLGLVHTTGPVSRAQLTASTGLNRSTVGALVGELVSLGLVTEREPDTTKQVGRPSLVIAPGQRTVALAVNPELDAVTIGLVGLGGQVLKRIRYDTLHVPTAPEVVNIVSAVVAGMRDELESNYATVGVGLAVPGLVRAGDGLVKLAPHLGWQNEPLAEMLQDALRLPVFAANDAAVGALAESLFGAGRGVSDLIYLNGGASGIGGGVVSRGALLTGESGYAGELGHTLVNSVGVPCHCGSTGCLETEVRRAPLLEALGLPASRAEELEAVLISRFSGHRGDADADAGAAAPASEASGAQGTPETPASSAASAPHTTDPALQSIVDAQIDFLAIAVRNAVNLCNPELLVLGGFLGSLSAVASDRLERAVARTAAPGGWPVTRITRSSLGADRLMIGAAELAFAPVLSDPAGTMAALAV